MDPTGIERVVPRRSPLRRMTRWPLWARPAVAIAAALVLGLVLSMIEVPGDRMLGRIAFNGDATDARQLLATVTSTMITVTSLVFVLTVVALQIASTQFSPRLLRSFLRDSGTQLVLSTFVGTVAYSLAGLHTVGSPDAGGTAFVPRLAVSGSLVLALVSVGMLVYYIQHITNGIRIDTIMSDIATMTLHLVRDTWARGQPDRTLAAPPDRPPSAVALVAPRSGYVQAIAPDALGTIAVRDGATVVITAMTGFHVVRGRPIGWVDGVDDVAAYQRAVGEVLVVHRERRIEQDVGFGLRQLVDIAGRGLSPSLNDPYSAVQAIHHATVVLTEMARRHVEPVRVRDAGGTVRLYASSLDLDIHLQVVCGHVRWSMAHRPNVALALLLMLENVHGETDDPARGAAIDREIALILDEAERVGWLDEELTLVREAGARARSRVVRDVAGPGPGESV